MGAGESAETPKLYYVINEQPLSQYKARGDKMEINNLPNELLLEVTKDLGRSNVYSGDFSSAGLPVAFPN